MNRSLWIGLVAGLINSVFGMGPGMFLTPMIHHYLFRPMKESASASLLLLIPLSGGAVGAHFFLHPVFPWFLPAVFLGSMLGSSCGVFIRNRIASGFLKKIFQIFLFLVIFRNLFVFFGMEFIIADSVKISFLFYFLLCLFSSTLSSLLGIGGGIIIITVFSLLHLPIKEALIPALYASFFNAILSSFADRKNLWWNRDLSMILMGGVIGILSGAYLWHFLAEEMMRTLYTIFLSLIFLRTCL